MKCLKCETSIVPKKGLINYCSMACRNSHKRSQSSKEKTAEKLRSYYKYKSQEERGVIFLVNCLYQTKIEYPTTNKDIIEKTSKCVMCETDFTYHQKKETKERKTCSDLCGKDWISLVRSENIVKNGTYNFKTKKRWAILNGEKFDCDSSLEIAGLVFIHHILKATHISKFMSILNFKVDGKTHRFNPDFFAVIEGQKTIVEVKMKWSSNSDHIYNRTMKQKKESLRSFCLEKQLKYIWLDFDYDKRFSKIYKKVLKTKDLEVNINDFILP